MNPATNEIRVMTSGAFTAAYLELIPQLEALTKKKIVTAATSIGTGESSIPSRLQRGEAVDVIIVADAVLKGFIKDGLVLAAVTHHWFAPPSVWRCAREQPSRTWVPSMP